MAGQEPIDASREPAAAARPPRPETAVLSASYVTREGAEERVAGILARYVVLTRGAARCRNVDLLVSSTRPGHFLVVEKWDDPDAARAHLDDPATAAMARELVAHLTRRPELDLWDGVSAHDLR